MGRLLRALATGGAGGCGMLLGLAGILIVALVAVKPPSLAPIAASQSWDLTVEISDALLTSRLNADMPNLPLQLRDAKATSRADGTVLITGSLSPAGVLATPPVVIPGLPLNPGAIAVPAEVILRPGVRDGNLVAEIVRTQLGPLPIPAQLGRLLEGPVNSQLASAAQGQPYRVNEIVVRDGSLLVRIQGEAR